MSGSLDLAFVLDCTCSMIDHIREARQKISNIVSEISKKQKSSSEVRLALVQFRDHGSPGYVTQVQPFTTLRMMQQALDRCDVGNGIDYAEAITCGLYKASQLDWRSGSRICVLVTDANPHGLQAYGDNYYANGCPSGHDPVHIANVLGEKGVTLHMLAVGSRIIQWQEFYMGLTWITGGLYIPLGSAGNMADIIVGSAKEDLSLQKVKDKVKEKVRRSIDPTSQEINPKQVSEELHTEFQQQGVKVFQLKFRDGDLPTMTGRAKRYARFDRLSEIKPLFREYSGQTGRTTGNLILEEREETVTLLQVQRMVQQAFLMCRAEG